VNVLSLYAKKGALKPIICDFFAPIPFELSPERIIKQADSLLKYSEGLLFMTSNTDISNTKTILSDNGGRRIGIERRQFFYNGYIPERRSGEDRRSELDRRELRTSKK
jgi:hypothetical protein